MPDTLNHSRTLTPYRVVPDADVEMRFLQAAFGATETLCHRNAEGKVMHAELTVGDSLVMVGQSSGQWKPLTAALYLWVPDVDATYARALEDRKSTRLNSSHLGISYAVFCLKKKIKKKNNR